MEKTAAPRPSKPPPVSPPVGCPFSELDQASPIIRRQDLLDLAEKFSASLKPAGDLLNQMKEQNEVQRDTNKCVKQTSKRQVQQGAWLILLTVGFFVVAVVQVFSGVLQYKTIHRQDKVVESSEKVQADLEQLTDSLVTLVDLAKSTSAGVKDIKDSRDEEAEVQLVPETDPVKALRTPVRIRIVSPRSKAGSEENNPPTPAPAIELPVKRQHTQGAF